MERTFKVILKPLRRFAIQKPNASVLLFLATILAMILANSPLQDRYHHFLQFPVKLVFGEHAKNMVINSTKSMTGHLLGAAGGVEAVACALQIKNSKVHRTLGLKVADPECDLDYAADGTRDMKITGALSNSLGFGGHNACIAFAPVED